MQHSSKKHVGKQMAAVYRKGPLCGPEPEPGVSYGGL